MTRISTIVPTRDTCELTCRCLASLHATERPADQIVLVDDGSRDGTAERVAVDFPGVEILRNPESTGFSAAANRGLAAADGDLLVLLNSDTEATPDTFQRVSDAFARDAGLGIAGAELVDPDGEPQWSGGRRPTPAWLFAMASDLGPAARRIPWSGRQRPFHRPGAIVDWVSGAAMAIRRRAWEAAGPFDLRFAFYCQDLDLCLRAGDAGWGVELVAGWRVLHHHGATIERVSATTGSQDLGLLWTDLLRWAKKQPGPREVRRARRALEWGGRFRRARLRLGALGRSNRAQRRRSELVVVERALDQLANALDGR